MCKAVSRLSFWLWAGVIVLSFVACRPTALWRIADPLPPTGTTPVTLLMQAPMTIAAGTLAHVKVRTANGAGAVDQPVRLLIIGTYGTTVLSASLVQGGADFVLDATITRFAGTVQLQASVADAVATTALQIVPGPPVEPLFTLLGPRSIPADGRHWAMAVTLPQDRFANGVADGTAVTLQILHPAAPTLRPQNEQANREVLVTEATQLLAWARIYSRTTAGRLYLAATAGAAHSLQQSLLVVPGPPAPFTIAAEPSPLTADGEQLITVQSSPLLDDFGNLLLDGTAITFVAEAEDGSRRTMPAQLIAGSATVQLQAPNRPGPITVRAFVLDRASPPLRLDFRAGLAPAPIAVAITIGDEEIQLRAGPLLGLLNQYIPDGSEVTFAVQRSGTVTQTISARSEAGFATALVRRNRLIAGAYSVRVNVGAGAGESTFILPAPP